MAPGFGRRLCFPHVELKYLLNNARCDLMEPMLAVLPLFNQGDMAIRRGKGFCELSLVPFSLVANNHSAPHETSWLTSKQVASCWGGTAGHSAPDFRGGSKSVACKENQ